MGVECLVHILGRLSSGQLNPVCSGQVWDVPVQFSGFLWDNLVLLGI